MSRKQRFWAAVILIGCSLLIEWSGCTTAILALFKYTGMAYGIVLLGLAALSAWKPYCKHRIGYILAVSILLCYTILALDTFLFHALTWFPGLIRYALFSTYLPFYFLFLLVSLLFKLGETDPTAAS